MMSSRVSLFTFILSIEVRTSGLAWIEIQKAWRERRPLLCCLSLEIIAEFSFSVSADKWTVGRGSRWLMVSWFTHRAQNKHTQCQDYEQAWLFTVTCYYLCMHAPTSPQKLYLNLQRNLYPPLNPDPIKKIIWPESGMLFEQIHSINYVLLPEPLLRGFKSPNRDDDVTQLCKDTFCAALQNGPKGNFKGWA